MTIAPPANISPQLVNGIESLALNEALSEAERHGSVIRPLTGHQAEGSAADHI
jgi:hypothetical protein